MNEEPQVLYCDAWLMAIDKPAGMIVHGDGTGERTLTDYASDRKMRVGASGKPSQTRVKVLKRLKSRRGLPARSYIDVELLTGRKHQIRVHLASERHPLVGDELYGTPRPCGLMLHAHSVSFTHPVTGEHIHIEAPCPWEP